MDAMKEAEAAPPGSPEKEDFEVRVPYIEPAVGGMDDTG